MQQRWPSRVFCKTCNLWIHQKCEGLSKADLAKLSTKNIDGHAFVCCVCKENQALSMVETSLLLNEQVQPLQPEGNITDGEQISQLSGPTSSQIENTPFPFNETSLPENEQSFQFEAQHLQDISLEDDSKIFKKKGLHFVHLNCNSLRSKIDEIREFVLVTNPHVISFSETKLDYSHTDAEIKIENYSCVHKDRNRYGGGVACYVHKSIAYDVSSDFSDDFENIFIDILPPKTTPILLGVVYRPPTDTCFVENLTNSIANSNTFDAQEVYIMGDINVNLIDRKRKLIHKKGYRFSKEESNYSTALHMTKKYNQFLKSYGLTQLIDEATRKTDKTASLLDHILVNTPDKVSQSGVLEKAISDHDMIYCTRKHQKIKSGQHNSIKLRSMKTYIKESLIEKLGEIEFPNYSNFECVNDAYNNFLTKVMDVIDKIAPLKEIRIKGNSKAWFGSDVMEHINIREKLRNKT